MDEHAAPPMALAGLRVIDASTGIAGPIAAMFLADFGADVVKIEPPTGDPSRDMPGSAVWNRNKRAGVIDPRDPDSVATYESLLDGADVLVTNTCHEQPTADHSRLVHLVAPAYMDGAPWPFTIESEGLLAATTGVALRQSSTAGGPIDAVFPIMPTVHGVWAATATVAALVERERSGRGQILTVGGVHGVMVASSAALNFDPSASPNNRPIGGPGGSIPFYRTYRCGDGEWLFLASLTPRFTAIAFEVLGVTDLNDDPRLEGRGRAGMLHPDNIVWITERIADVFATQPRQVWLDRLKEAGCPAGPVLARDDWLDHPQLDAIGMRVELDDPQRGHVVMPGVPITLVATPGRVRAAAPPRPTDAPDPWTEPHWRLEAPDTTMATSSEGGPLAEVQVVDLGAIIAGPYAGSLLGELGASVTKVEPLTGDSFRGPGFAAYNKTQRGIAIDLQHPQGRHALLEVIRRSDVVIDNYRPGVLGRLGLDWENLRQVRPDIISVSITGFGDRGPLGSEAGFDPVLQAMSGMMAAQGGDAEPGFFTVPVNDVTAAATTALGAVLALLHRIHVGAGQKVTTSLAAMAALQQAGELVRYEGRPPARVGGADHRGPSVLDRYYQANDGWIRILDPASQPSPHHLDELGVDGDDEHAVATWVAKRSRAEAVGELLSAGIPAVTTRPARELIDDEAITLSEVLRPDDRPGREGSWTTGVYAAFSRTPVRVSRRAPDLGEHTVEVLMEAGYTEAQVDQLAENGIIARSTSPTP